MVLALVVAVGCRATSLAVAAREAIEEGRARLATMRGVDLATARENFELAAARAREARSDALELEAMTYLARVADRVGHQRDRRARWTAVLDRAKEPALRFEAELALAEAEECLGDHDAAGEHANAALAGSAAGSVEWARARMSLALLASHRDEHQTAIRDLLAILPVFERAGRGDLVAEARGTIASSQTRIGDWDAVDDSLTEALAAAEAYGDPIAIGATLNRRAVWLINHRRDYEQGIAVYDRAIALFEGAGHRYLLPYALDGSAVAMSTLDRREGTVERHLEALAIRRELGSARGEAQTLTSLGETYTRFGRYDEAAEVLDRALALHERNGDRFFQVYTLFRRARVEESRDRFADAVRIVSRAIEIDESLRSRLASRHKRSHFSAQARWRYDLYVNSSVRSGAVLEALAMSEATRARAFREVMGRARTSTSADEAVRPLADRVEGLERDRRRAVLRDATTQELAKIDEQIATALARYERIELKARGRPRPIDTPLGPDALARIGPELLDDGDVLLEYYLGAGGSYVFVVTTSTVTARALPRAGTIEEAARDLHADLIVRNDRKPDESVEAFRARVAEADARVPAKSKAVSKLLLEPVAPWVDAAKRVIVVADGVLHRLPYAALAHPNRDAWLGLEVEVVESPSISVVRALREREKSKRALGVAAIADPVFSAQDPRLGGRAATSSTAEPFLPRLPFTRQEVEALEKLVPANRFARLLDFEASRAAVLGGAVADKRIVHFATHGVLDPASPELSALVLSRFDSAGRPVDGALRLQDLDALHIHADLVVLSGCETAVGRRITGEGLISLTRGFLHAGADQVLATMWKVEDRETARTVATFYEAMLAKGRPPGAALLDARRATARRRGAALPYYWAGFTLQGDPRPRR